MASVKDFRDRHAGKLGFVIGSGPSLHKVDTEVLKDYVTFAVNSSLSKIQFADYFVADDIGVKNWNYYANILPTVEAVPFLFIDKLKDHAAHLDEDKIVWFKHTWWFDPKNKTYNEDGLIMTKDEPIIGARTTAGSAVHLAYIMGCDPIVLLGCDCCYEGSRRYYWQFKDEKKCYRLTGEQVFSFPNRGLQNGRPVDAHSVDFLEYWEALGKQVKKQEINVIDASGGLIKSFPKSSLDKVLEEYGDRRKDDK